MRNKPLKTGFALLAVEGFEGFGTTLASNIDALVDEKYETSITSGNLKLRAGTRQGFRAEFGSTLEEWFRIAIPATGEIVIGGRFLTGTVHSITAFLLTENGGTAYVNLLMGNAGNITVRNGTTNLQQTTNQMATNTEYFVELKTKIDNTTGTYELRVNGVVWASGSGVDTQNGASANVDTVRFNPGGANSGWDDIYILDTTGTKNNDFLGSNIDVIGLHPDGDGNQNDWTPDTGTTNYTQVDDNPSDADSSYVESTPTVGDKDLYTFGNLSAGTVPLGVQVNHIVRMTAGSANVVTVARSGASESDGSSQNVSATTYDTGVREVYEDVPGGTGWTDTQVNGAEFGIKVVT